MAVKHSTGTEKSPIVRKAIASIRRQLKKPGQSLSDPSSVGRFFVLELGKRKREHFCVAFLDAQNRLIAAEEMFRGTLYQTEVHPREIVRRALELNAASVIFCHNHPSGSTEPSKADIDLTWALKASLDTVGVRILDHFIVAGANFRSFAAESIAPFGESPAMNEPKPNGSNRYAELQFETLDNVSLGLSQARSTADILACLASTGDIDSLGEHSLSTALVRLTEKLEELHKLVNSDAARGIASSSKPAPIVAG